MDLDIITLPDMRVAAIAHRGPYVGIAEAFARLGAIAGESGLFVADATMLAAYYDDPRANAPAGLRSDACITVSDTQSLPAGVGERRLPGGRHLRARHLGSYATLPATWDAIATAARQYRQRAAPSLEIYRNSPHETAESELITDVCVPIE